MPEQKQRPPRRASAESMESKVLREAKGGTVSFAKSWRNFEVEAPDYDRRTEARLASARSRKQTVGALQLLCVVSSAAYLGLASAGNSPALLVPFKALPICLMLGIVLTLGERRSYGTRVAAGLVFCAVGDVCLELESVASLSAQPLFLLGLASGFIGHCAYAFAFFSQAPLSIRTASLPVACAAAIFSVLRTRVPADLLLPVVAYILAIALMLALAL